eukprot:1175705-Prorocentrum_minimum.AAC.7
MRSFIYFKPAIGRSKAYSADTPARLVGVRHILRIRRREPSCANNGKDALNTPGTLPLFSTRVQFPAFPHIDPYIIQSHPMYHPITDDLLFWAPVTTAYLGVVELR